MSSSRLFDTKTNLARETQKAKALAEKCGVMWECFNRTPDPESTSDSSGYLYHFRLRDELDIYSYPEDSNTWINLIRTNKSTFPAVEHITGLYNNLPGIDIETASLVFSDIEHLFVNLTKPGRGNVSPSQIEESITPFMNSKNKMVTHAMLKMTESSLEDLPLFLYTLGYQLSFNTTNENRLTPIITLPDTDLLLSRLNRKYPNRPIPFEISDSHDDIASHLEFIEATVQGHHLHSKKREFFHDHMAHLIPRLDNLHLVMTLGPEDRRMMIRSLERTHQSIKTGYAILKQAFADLEKSKLASTRLDYTKSDLDKLVALYALAVDFSNASRLRSPATSFGFDFSPQYITRYESNDYVHSFYIREFAAIDGKESITRDTLEKDLKHLANLYSKLSTPHHTFTQMKI